MENPAGFPENDPLLCWVFPHRPSWIDRTWNLINPKRLRYPQTLVVLLQQFLVGGWPTPLKNMSSSVGIILPKIWKHKKCSKPPTSAKNSIFSWIHYCWLLIFGKYMYISLYHFDPTQIFDITWLLTKLKKYLTWLSDGWETLSI